MFLKRFPNIFYYFVANHKIKSDQKYLEASNQEREREKKEEAEIPFSHFYTPANLSHHGIKRFSLSLFAT